MANGASHYSQAANLAVNQTLVRSINTSVVALLPVAAILVVGFTVLGPGTLLDLSLALFVGIAAGTYSSIFIATPLLADLREREPAMQQLKKRAERYQATRGRGRPGGAGRGGGRRRPAARSRTPRSTPCTAAACGRRRHGAVPPGPPLRADRPAQPAQASSEVQALGGSSPDDRADPSRPRRSGSWSASRLPRHPRLPRARGVVQGLHAPARRRRRPCAAVVQDIATRRAGSVDLVVGIEARGFILGAAGGLRARRRLRPGPQGRQAARATSLHVDYELEYGTATIEVHADAFVAGARVLVVDDVLATGGTAVATCDLLERAGAKVVAFEAVVELGFLRGRERLAAREVHTIVTALTPPRLVP